MYHNIQLCSPDDVCHGTEVEADRTYEEVELKTPFTREHNVAYSTTYTTVAALTHRN